MAKANHQGGGYVYQYLKD